MSPRLLPVVLFSATLSAAVAAPDPPARAQVAEDHATTPVVDPDDVLATGGAPWKGGLEARVVIVEFADYQCPFSARVHATLDRLLGAYPDDVRLVFRHFPLAFHADAHLAAEAAMAAHEQGRFWSFHEEVFGHQQALTRADLSIYAQRAGLDVAAFDAELAAGTYVARVDGDVALGNRLGVTGTPGFLINGAYVSGAQDFDHFRALVEAEIVAVQGLLDQGRSLGEALGERMQANLATH